MRTKPLKLKVWLFIISLCLCCFMSYSQNTYPWPSSGPIGIGVASPNGNLHIRNSSDGASDGYSGIRFYPATSSTTGESSYHRIWGFRKSGLWIGGSTNGSTYLKSNILLKDGGIFFGFSNGTTNPESAANTHFTVLNGGNVGIGTTSPAAKLHVYDGGIKISVIDHDDDAIRIECPSGGSNFDVLSVIQDGQYNASILSTGLTSFKEVHTEGLVIHSGGYFEMRDAGQSTIIKFSNGDATFAGKVTAEEIEVKADVWSDHVFDKDYKLAPVEEVAAFINTNKHLPGVPSEAEVKENGLNLGEMDAILLKKIEELTLYIIDLKKENQELRELIESK